MTVRGPLKGVILAAGYGTRMAALTQVVPKPLLPIVNIPTVERILQAFKGVGVTDILIITGYRADAVEAYCGDGARWGMSIHYQPQTEVSGTGSAAAMAAEYVGDQPFMLTYGDILLDAAEYQAVVDLYQQPGCEAATTLNRLKDVSTGSAVYLDGNRIREIIEKPPPGTSTSNLNNAGVFVFPPAIFDAIARTPRSIRGEYELTEAVQTMVSDGTDVRSHVIPGVQYDIGTPETYMKTNISLIGTFSNPDTHRATADNFASPNLDIEPPVAISETSEIERCRLGPNVCIADGVRIGHSVSIRNSVIMPGADIGDGASLSFAIIGRCASVSNRARLQGRAEEVVVAGDGEMAE